MMVKKTLLLLFATLLASCGGKQTTPQDTVNAFYQDVLTIYQKYPLAANETYPRQKIDPKMETDIKKLTSYFLIENAKQPTDAQIARCAESLTTVFTKSEIVSFFISRCDELSCKKAAYAKVKLQYAYRGQTGGRTFELVKVGDTWKIVFAI